MWSEGWRGRGLRVRVAAAFAGGGLVLSTVLALLTYVLADRYLTNQRETSASRQAYLYARVLRDEIGRGTADDVALATLEVPVERSIVIHHGASWSTTDAALGQNVLPGGLRRAVRDGRPVRQRAEVNGVARLVIGLPVPKARLEFFMIFPLQELASTLGALRNILAGAAGITTVAAAFLGAWAGRRVLRPLADVGVAAGSIAGGNLGARLEVENDPDLEELARSFNAMVEALAARIERDARFASDVSHELRSPLTTLASAMSVLERRRADLPDRAVEAVDLLTGELGRFQRLVAELLELARAEADTDDVVAEPVELDAMVRAAVAATASEAHVDVGVGGDRVLLDKRRLDRILVNLLENAAVHGRGAVRITVSNGSGRIRIEVDDRGPGVPAEQRAQIFDRFYRGAASGRRGDDSGTGLGLALVSEHARVMGGGAWVEDRPDASGARFVVELPRRRV